MPGTRRLALAACVIGCCVLAGCSSGPSASAQARAQRAAVLPAAKHLNGQIVGAGVAWTADIDGQYWPCGTDDPAAEDQGSSEVQYSAEQFMTSFSRNTAFGTFSRQVTEALDAAGWHLRARKGPSSSASYYSARHSGLDLWLILFNEQQSFGPTATIDVSGSCFDAGSSATSLTGATGPQDQVSEPRPTSTPTPRYP